MSRCINQMTIIGGMGHQPELRSTKGGSKVAQFVVATSRKWHKADGTEADKTEWHRCVAWNGDRGPQLADIVMNLGRKGLRVYVQGRLEYRSYENHEGVTKWVTEIVVSEFLALDRNVRATDLP